MGRTTRLELDPEVSSRVTVRFHRRLPAGVTLSAPTALVQERVRTRPEDWDTADGISVQTAAVVDATDDRGQPIAGGEGRAVQVVIVDSDADPDTPARGSGYRVFITATRSDGGTITAKNPLTIRP